MITKTIFQKKILLFLWLIIPHFLFAQDLAQNTSCSKKIFGEKIKTTDNEPLSYLFLHVDYDKKSHLLTIHTRDQLKNATITILTSKENLIYQESGIKINNNYLLSIEENSPKGIYYIYVEEKDRGIWIERFIK